MDYAELLKGIVRDVRIALSFSTILPVGPVALADDGEITRASWALPVAGLVVGLIGAALYAIAHKAGLTSGPAAMLALAATILVTGAIHEDGLADTADGLGGGRTRESRLGIMRDSRIGSYGACALVISILLRWSALASIGESERVAIALLVSHAAGRSVLPAFMWLVPAARLDGLSARAGEPPGQSAMIALGLGALCLLFGFGVRDAIAGLVLLALAGLTIAWLANILIGGQTGDILGTLEQAGEIAIMLLAAAILQTELRP
jgi:adenosylcobinamide-GDP ribazoletransferase